IAPDNRRKNARREFNKLVMCCKVPASVLTVVGWSFVRILRVVLIVATKQPRRRLTRHRKCGIRRSRIVARVNVRPDCG
ncbi:MAG: hypothetical protein MUE84_03145, partial [Hyphomonas sp.]|nr:hypothetical protein [Hyphomonas sp.]